MPAAVEAGPDWGSRRGEGGPADRLVIAPPPAAADYGSPPARIIAQACRLGNGSACRGVKAGFSARFAMMRWPAPTPVLGLRDRCRA